MTRQAGDTAVAADRHVAWFYDDPSDVVDRLADRIEHDRRAGIAVVVTLPDHVRRPLFGRIGPDRVTTLDLDHRYTRPIDAVASLWRFTCDAVDEGATAVHSIGQLAFAGDERDGAWHHYEAAMSEVLADLPLTATCLYDRRATSLLVQACAHVTHPVALGGARPDLEVPEDAIRPVVVTRPARAPDLEMIGPASPAAVRQSLRRLIGGMDDAMCSRIALVASELVTNAMLYGGGAVEVRCWSTPRGVVLEVADDGPGVHDPFAGLRPPALPERGAGLWLCQLQSTAIHVGSGPGGRGTVVTALVD